MQYYVVVCYEEFAETGIAAFISPKEIKKMRKLLPMAKKNNVDISMAVKTGKIHGEEVEGGDSCWAELDEVKLSSDYIAKLTMSPHGFMDVEFASYYEPQMVSVALPNIDKLVEEAEAVDE